MILPTNVIAYILNLLKDNRFSFPVMTDPVEGSEDTDANVDKASIIVYSDFDEKAELDTSRRIIKIPCSIYITCTSASFETGSESFNQAFMMAIVAYQLIARNNIADLIGTNNQTEPVQIQCQDIPLRILRKSADGSTVQVALRYLMTRI
jgi:hypothetical protein